MLERYLLVRARMPVVALRPALVAILVSSSFRAHGLQTVQPWTYRSPSGAVEFFVDPTERFGRGPARCRLTRDGQLLWEREVPFTLRDALVEEYGSVGGYAYSEGGVHGSELVVSVLAPDGTERGGERVERTPSRTMHAGPFPTIGRLRRCDGGFALEVLNTRRGYEWIYGWENGARIREGDGPPPTEDPEVDPPPPVPIPGIALTLLGRVTFPWPVPPIEAGSEEPLEEHRQRAAHHVFVDSRGRVWISELATRRVHVFEATGTPLFERTPDLAHFRPYRACDWLSVRDDGALFVCANGAIESFDAAGAHGPRESTGDLLPPRWWFLPSSKTRWDVGDAHSIRLVGAAGEILSATERAPNGRWLEALRLSAMDVDGTLAVLDEPIGAARDPAQWVHVLAPDGEPVHSVRLTRKVEAWLQGALALRDGRLALVVEGGVLFLRSTDGAPIGLAPLPAELRKPAHLFFSPDGRELWVFPHMRAEMWRFQVPW